MSGRTKKLALCGVLSALAVALMALGTLFPLATFCCPLLASLVLIVVRAECGGSMAAGVWVVTAALSILLAPDKEAAALFCFLGFYPVLKPVLERIRTKPFRMTVKLAVFNLAICLLYTLLLWVFQLDSLTAELESFSRAMTALMLLLGNVTFVLYDLLLARLELLYRRKLQKTVHRIF